MGYFSSADDVESLIEQTINTGVAVWNYNYRELCTAVYWTAVNAIANGRYGDKTASDSLKNVACAGLAEAARDRTSKTSVAWTLRYTMNAILEDVRGLDRSNSFDWLPVGTAGSMSSRSAGS